MLTIQNLAKTYGGAAPRPVFRNLSLELVPGDSVAIMGESGVGKSTLLNIIAGLDQPDSGDVFIEGMAINQLREPARTLLRRSKIGFVFQAFHLLPYLTVAGNVKLPLLLNGMRDDEAEQRVAAQLSAVELQDRAASFPRQLSGGEMQRVAVARALAHEPAVVLADEPTGNLDADSAALVLRQLRDQIKQTNSILLLVTHSPSAAATMDRILQLTPAELRAER
jgi:putative ABC transport system ATP-binding protein